MARMVLVPFGYASRLLLFRIVILNKLIAISAPLRFYAYVLRLEFYLKLFDRKPLMSIDRQA